MTAVANFLSTAACLKPHYEFVAIVELKLGTSLFILASMSKISQLSISWISIVSEPMDTCGILTQGGGHKHKMAATGCGANCKMIISGGRAIHIQGNPRLGDH